MDSNEPFDLVILGGGPAGMAAAIYAGRARLRTVVLDAMGGGGQMAVIDRIENYPGFVEAQVGMDLSAAMRQQMEQAGVEIVFDQVESLKAQGELLMVHASAIYATRCVLVATGARHRELNLESEERLKGRGVSYCATCDGAFFKGQHVAVIGGGDTAVKDALYLARVVDRVTLVHRRDHLRAEKLLQERLFQTSNIQIRWDTVVEEIEGEKAVTGLRLKNVKTKEASLLPVTGVFVFVGITPNTDFLQGMADLDPRGFVLTDARMRTSHPRIFAAGDVRSESARQIGTAVGDGITAAVHISEMQDTFNPPRA